jgi:hypothetical protein
MPLRINSRKYLSYFHKSAIHNCENSAINLKKSKIYSIKGHISIINNIINYPENHYKNYIGYKDMFSYVEYLIYYEQLVS